MLGAVFALLVVLGAVLVAHRHVTPSQAAEVLHPLAIVPAGPALLVSVDVVRLRKTPAGAAFVAKSLTELAHEPCESALLGEIDELAFAMPSDSAGTSSTDAFALIAAGRFTAAKLSACAEARIETRHGDPVKTTIGSFTSVRDRSHTGEIAVRDGLFVLSDGPYLRALIDAADGHRPDGTPAEHQRDELHVELRRSVGHGAPVIATLALPPGWLSRTLADATAEQSPLAAIRTAALRADTTDQVAVAGIVGCETGDACEGLERFVAQARSDLVTFEPSYAELFAHVHLVRTAARIAFDARFSAPELEKLWGTQRGEAADAGAPQSHGP